MVPAHWQRGIAHAFIGTFMKHVQIIMGSVRPVRMNEQVAAWVRDLAAQVGGLTFEIIDLKDWHLPMDDEPVQPSKGGYMQEHTVAWSRKISEADGYIFVTPQYNWGYPAALKNALDHLYKEWHGKPALIVTYGHRGGVRAAGQLRQVLDGLHMKSVEAMPALVFHDEMLDSRRLLTDMAVSFAQYEQPVVAGVRDLAVMLAA